ncbi:MAG TPA: CheR family methyltransferase [Spirochaetota bacterium]|nr:CheR family methyltransferase [Spirochaetota bacterium]
MLTNDFEMSEKEREKISGFIEKELGIKMPPAKKALLQSRLSKRLRILGFSNYGQYYDYIMTPTGKTDEISIFVDLVSTHVTHFFREEQHFNYLYSNILPEIVNNNSRSFHTIKIWSAGCSTGEEVYSIAMIVSEFLTNIKHSNCDFEIYGTDLSPNVVEKAKNAIYYEENANNIPLDFKKKYFLRSKDKSKNLIRVSPELRMKTKFKILNFLDSDYKFNSKFDLIFCRNVLIYFDKQTQEKIINNFSKCLIAGGYLILGHSETIIGLKVNFSTVAPTIYRRT